MLLMLLFLPLLGFLGGSLFGRFLGYKGVAFLTSLNIFIALICAINLFHSVIMDETVFVLKLGTWINSANLDVAWTILADQLSIPMSIVVLFISLLVHLYSTVYMSADPHFPRFMAYLSLFTFFMEILLLADTFLQMFVGWEGVGLSSFLLINFWYRRIQANKAAIKAMLYNRAADLMMLIGLGGVFILFETFDYTIVFSVAPLIAATTFTMGNISITALDGICIFLFLGAMGKSAQLGFQNWLPDAMEGPTPVSALIHAATMVTAGVFLLIRCSYFFSFSPNTLTFVAIIGALTALFGATVGLYMHDLKRVVAFSTCSQLGYMMLACGLAQYDTAFFHLSTHAVFKALLFLTAGAIIHAVNDEQDARKLGGLLRYLPITYICFLVGSLNLMGLPFLSGFFSKDAILEVALTTYSTSGLFCYVIGLIAASCTAAYSVRALLLIFLVETNASKTLLVHLHEASGFMRFVIVLLAVTSIFFGAFTLDLYHGVGNPFFSTTIFYNINLYNNHDHEFLTLSFKILPQLFVGLGLTSSILSYLMYAPQFFSVKIAPSFQPIYSFLLKKWYTDRTNNTFISLPILFWSQEYSYHCIDRGLLELVGPTQLVTSTEEYITNKPFRTTLTLANNY